MQTQISLLNSNFGQYLNHSIVKRLTKALIRLRVCAGWFEPLLVARKYHVAAQLSPILEIIHIHVNTPCYRASVEPQFADTKVRSKDGKKSRYKCFPCIESKHLMLWLVLLGACADPGFFAGGGGGGGGRGVQARFPENSSDNFFSPQHYRGCPMGMGGWGVQMLISIETHITYDFPGGGGVQTPYPPLDPRMGRLCVCTCPSSEPSLLANATSTRIRLVSRDACNEQMINCNCTHQSPLRSLCTTKWS